jgi:hypothetical protein
VIIGVAVELLGDGGIFIFSEQLQSIANDRVTQRTNVGGAVLGI